MSTFSAGKKQFQQLSSMSIIKLDTCVMRLLFYSWQTHVPAVSSSWWQYGSCNSKRIVPCLKLRPQLLPTYLLCATRLPTLT